MPPKRRVEAIEEEEDGVKLVSLHDPEEDEKAEEEKEAHLDEIERNAIVGMMNSLKGMNPEAYRDIIIETLYKQFARENRATRSKETIFSELDKLEAWEASIWRPLTVCLIG